MDMSIKICRFVLSLLALLCFVTPASAAENRPNILLILADNWAWPHASAYGDRVVETPTFDQVAREGMLFSNAFCVVPSCAPSRAALLTGQTIHRLGSAGSNWGHFSSRLATYPNLLAAQGYTVGFAGKGWGPGDVEQESPEFKPAGPEFESFASFMKELPEGKPFCFWFGSRMPHRKWTEGESRKMKRDDVKVPAYLPDTEAVRDDILNYYAEVETFDREAGELLSMLAASGRAENTLVIVGSDNGWQMPRGLANVYDSGTHVPLAMRWPKRIKPGSKTNTFINFDDFAPTLLAAAGMKVPAEMTGHSFLPLLEGKQYTARDCVFLERERHANVRRGDLSYPVRSIRTADYLYVRNFEPDRWPAGDPTVYWSVGDFGDVDPSPTKELILAHRDQQPLEKFYQLSFAKRPAEELYDLKQDRHQIHNVADDANYALAKQSLQQRLSKWMQQTGDPRASNPRDDRWERYPYLGHPAKGKE
jgi:N-sulfoglucosamine sulfohydrolase